MLSDAVLMVIVTVPAETVKLAQEDAAPDVRVTVYAAVEVKNTLSADVGTEAPVGVSVGLADQFAVLSQLPVPTAQ
jgi:hypothetical protein